MSAFALNLASLGLYSHYCCCGVIPVKVFLLT